MAEAVGRWITLPRMSAGALTAAAWSYVASVQFPELSEVSKIGLPSLVVVVCLFGMWIASRQRETEAKSSKQAMERMMRDYATSVALKDAALDKRHEETVSLVKDVLGALSKQVESNNQLASAVSELARSSRELQDSCRFNWRASQSVP